MCGISGFFDHRARMDEASATVCVSRMTDALAHRGPDDAGIWVDAPAGIAFGHRRLSVIDLSPLGHQPMTSTDGRYLISYNGEVYNFGELRAELAALGHHFRGGSDTEVMLAAFSTWGPEHAVTRFVGMFAFALWDRQTRTLRLVRDRLGVKPLYYGLSDGRVMFASELKGLMAHTNWGGELNPDSVGALMRYSHIPGPATIFRHVYKLPAGTILTVSKDREPVITPYWRLRDAAVAGQAHPLADEAEATDELDRLLRVAIRGRMIADVPLGAFLSGGVDSSTVVALMQAQSTRKVRTFSVGFDDVRFNEAEHAKAIAGHLGTDHTELYVTAQDALDIVPRLPEWFDEPFADSSQIPTCLVAAMARKHVTVALSGDGGDEVFAGYPRYRLDEQIWSRIGVVPLAVRHGAAAIIRRTPEPWLDGMVRLLPRSLRPLSAGRKMHRLADLVGVPAGDDLYAALAAVWPNERALVPTATNAGHLALDPSLAAALPDVVSRMQVYDTLGYLPDDILVKVDRASMAVGLEAREPLLDHRLVEFAWRLPSSFKLKNGGTKRILRSVLYRYVPPTLIDRPKMGFSVPLAEWLRGPLRDWAESLLAPARLAADGLFDAAEVRTLWDQHQAGTANRDRVLWNVLMFRAWKERY